jgi:hypothetical protein
MRSAMSLLYCSTSSSADGLRRRAGVAACAGGGRVDTALPACPAEAETRRGGVRVAALRGRRCWRLLGRAARPAAAAAGATARALGMWSVQRAET